MMEGVFINYLGGRFRLSEVSANREKKYLKKVSFSFWHSLLPPTKKCWSIDAIAGFFAGFRGDFA